MDVSSSVSKSGSKSCPHLRFLAYASWLKNRALGRGVCIYTYPGGTPSILDRWDAWLLLGGNSGVSGGCGICSHVGCLSRAGGGAPMPLWLQRVWAFHAMLFWQGRHTSVWFSPSIAGCLSIAAVTFLCPGNWTSRFFSSRTSARGFLIWNCVSPIAVRKNPPLAILAIFKARRMSDCSSCTRPPYLAIVADMFKTYKETGCCIYIVDSAITSTIYASVASCNVFKVLLVRSRGFVSLNLFAKFPELTVSWGLISQTVQTNALVDHRGFRLQVAIHWSRSSPCTPAVCYIINWGPYTSI